MASLLLLEDEGPTRTRAELRDLLTPTSLETIAVPSDDNLDRVSRMLGLMGDLGKLLATLAAALFMVGALAAPDWIRGRLEKLDLKFESIDTPIGKIVARHTPQANAHTLQVAEALTQLEVAVAGDMPGEKAQKLLKNIREAKKALGDQSRSIEAVARGVGLEPQTPATAWVYVGYYAENGRPARLSDRVNSSGLDDAGKLRNLVLNYDSPVSSDGDDCTRTEIGNAPAFDPRSLTRKLMIVRASKDPLQVVRTAECASVGRGKTVYAEIEVPSHRVRFAELSTLAR